MLSLANIYTLYFRLYFRLCIRLNKLSINKYVWRTKQEQVVKSFKYLVVTLTYNSKSEIIIIATATSITVRLEMIRRIREISFKIKFNLYNSLIISPILFMALKRELLSKNLRNDLMLLNLSHLEEC